MADNLHSLFPTPGDPPAHLSPPHWPGASPNSTDTLLEVLKHNHEHWHTFINEKHFHNHAPHRSLALWSLGADGEVIRAGYEKDCGYEKPAMDSPGKITKTNWFEHLGDERYYHAYLEFFEDSLRNNGITHTLEEYLFGTSANVGHDWEGMFSSGSSGPQPKMLGRFFSGVVHPLIHTGYGLEFGLPGMMAEGLAQTAVHSPASALLVPSYLFESSAFGTVSNFTHSAGKGLHDALSNTIQSLDAAFGSFLPKEAVDLLRHDPTGEPRKTSSNDVHPENSEYFKGKDVHALDILGWVSKDMRFLPPDSRNRDSFDEMIGKHAETLLKFAHLWHLDGEKLGSDRAYLDGKIEELAFVAAVMFGVGGWTGRGKREGGKEALFNADFFLMHLVTSSAFIPSICAYITPMSRARFLHTYLVVALALYVFRGCPALDIVGFQLKMKEPQPVGPQPHPSKGTLPSPDSEKAVNPDPWLPIIQTSMVHPDEHVPKTQRALSNWAAHFGKRKFKTCSAMSKLSDAEAAESAGLGMGWGRNGNGNGEGCIPLELEGAEYLDGTVFLKTAELTAARMGRVREGQPEAGGWDFKGFFDKVDSSGPRKAHL